MAYSDGRDVVRFAGKLDPEIKEVTVWLHVRSGARLKERLGRDAAKGIRDQNQQDAKSDLTAARAGRLGSDPCRFQHERRKRHRSRSTLVPCLVEVYIGIPCQDSDHVLVRTC